MQVKQEKEPKVLQGGELTRRENFYEEDETLHKILESILDDEFLAFAKRELHEFGELCANEIDVRAVHTDREGEPRLLTHNKYGEEISKVWVNEGYKQTRDQTYNTGIVGYVHKKIPALNRRGNYTYSFAQGYLLSQAEPGFYCPVTLTLATSYLLDHYGNDDIKEKFLPYVCSTGELPLYEGATFLTERQGGSDVGANIVKAIRDGDQYRIYGEKYFASNAGMCGVAMVLARIEGAPEGSRGLTLFAVPWQKDNGRLNDLKIRRLKDKLGVRAVPSAEVEFNGSLAYVVGDWKKGFYYMMEALNLSRVANAVASVGIMRRAFTEALSYTSQREAFGQRLIEFPMIQDTLGKLKAKLHAELITIFDMIKLFDRVTNNQVTKEEVILNRLFIAIMKKEAAAQSIHFCHEAIELHGGNGYIEDFVTPRLLRDAQVLTVWEGTENILALELVRLVNKYEAHKLFINTLKGRLEQLTDNQLTNVIHAKLKDISNELDVFSGMSYNMQTFEAKSLAEKMAHLYESVIVLEWAERYQGKFVKLADIYIEDTWHIRELGDQMTTVNYFKDIIYV